MLWGGETLFADPSTRGFAPSHHRFENRQENKELMRVGIGRYVMPKPNRLVFIGSGWRHSIAKIAAAAGSHARVTVAGFFHTREGLTRLMRA